MPLHVDRGFFLLARSREYSCRRWNPSVPPTGRTAGLARTVDRALLRRLSFASTWTAGESDWDDGSNSDILVDVVVPRGGCR